ncbi:bifunctional metallophosphatase/5'-nucleotidase [Clostridium omnivorum]|uniref:5'-nucleotidase n=1 Tax=Clostridium omnivorum TaxID=1604902 RepID=A0ABQ5NC16_9CLOT|nr:bifunctional UDP-sugar hydrolase/5'-nucleotidase [Clostridium sp. E14]GLC32793.1 5'-nucleotidase [Clostridium sp. E14]
MKTFIRGLCILLCVLMLQPMGGKKVFADNNEKTMTILFTHDMHDHLLPTSIQDNGQVVRTGGYAELQSAINAEKKSSANSILVDAGDYSMGTLFQSIYSSDAPELRILGQMGYDAVTLGNHEFDFRANGLADSLNVAKNSGDKLPQIVQSNVSFNADKSGNLSQSLANLKKAMSDYGIKDYTVIEKNGIKIGVFGLIGLDAADSAPMAEVKFTDVTENAKRVVDILKNKEKVDMIICLSHSGVDVDKSKSEDEKLAKNVPEIDVIISGHTHTKLEKPIVVGSTIIGSCGEYSENLGVINITQNSDKRWKLNNYKLDKIDNTLTPDSNISKTIEKFKSVVEQKYLNRFDMKFDEILAYSTMNFVPSSDIGKKHGEDTLGNLITDAYIYAVKKAEGANYEPVAAAFVPTGTIRGSFVKGNITVSDAFNASSLGIGADKISGYPLISVYLTGKELKTACEVDASISPVMSSAQLYMSGLNFAFNPNRIILNKVTKANLQKPDGTLEIIEDKKLYRVVVGLYSAQMLSVVGEKSYGLLSIVPKTKDGKPITDFEAQIIKDNSNGNNYEVKEWFAIAEYLKSFDKVNGVSQIPKYYSETHERKVVLGSHNIIAMFSSPNVFSISICAIIIVVIALVIFIIVRIATRKKRRAKKAAKKISPLF